MKTALIVIAATAATLVIGCTIWMGVALYRMD